MISGVNKHTQKIKNSFVIGGPQRHSGHTQILKLKLFLLKFLPEP